jgi:hypothetical protein
MPGPDDLIYAAEIEDNTGEFFDNFDDRVDEMENSLDGVFSGLEGGAVKLGAIMGAVGGAVGFVTGKLLDLAYTGAQAFVGLLKGGDGSI